MYVNVSQEVILLLRKHFSHFFNLPLKDETNHTHISDFLFESYVLGTIEYVTNCSCDSKVIHSVDVQLIRHPWMWNVDWSLILHLFLRDNWLYRPTLTLNFVSMFATWSKNMLSMFLAYAMHGLIICSAYLLSR